MSTYVVSGKPRPPLEVSHIDGLDESGDDRVVQARIVEVRELVHSGALIEAVGMCCGGVVSLIVCLSYVGMATL